MNDKQLAVETVALRSVLWQPVFELFKDDVKTFLWFNTPNPLLGGCSPFDMIMKGREAKLQRFIESCVEENMPDAHAERIDVKG